MNIKMLHDATSSVPPEATWLEERRKFDGQSVLILSKSEDELIGRINLE